MFGRRNSSSLLNKPELKPYQNTLHERAKYLEHKFKEKRARDIKPEYVEGILKNIQNLEDQLNGLEENDSNLENTLESLSFQCEAALVFYYDKDDLGRYFETLKKKVIPLLKSL